MSILQIRGCVVQLVYSCEVEPLMGRYGNFSLLRLTMVSMGRNTRLPRSIYCFAVGAAKMGV